MSEIKEKKKLSTAALVLIIGIVIIAIPCLVFAGILGISALQTGSPRQGSRFDNDLTVQITDADVATIKSDLEAIGNVETVEVSCGQGQLKVFIDTNDNLTEADVDNIMTEAYNKVTSKLPIGTYFTKTDSAKMYDLQINVYTTAEASEIGATNPRQYKLLHKNSAEEAYQIDNLAQPKNEDIARELEFGDDEETEVDDTTETTEQTTEE